MMQDSEEELPDMSDEQMFKMDKLLAAVLRTQKDAKDRSKTTKQVGLESGPLSTFISQREVPRLATSKSKQVCIIEPCFKESTFPTGTGLSVARLRVK